MNYSQLLNEYIKKSGLTLGEIVKRMQEEKGLKIDRSYISKLKNDPKYPASEEINRALAEIVGGDPEKLVLAGYYEKAPDEVKKLMDKKDEFDKFYDYLMTKVDSLKTPDETHQNNEEFDKLIKGLLKLPENERGNYLRLLLFNFSIDEPERAFSLAVKRGFDPTGYNTNEMYLLKKLREKANKTTKDMAKLLNVTESKYKEIEAFWGHDNVIEHKKIYELLVEHFLTETPLISEQNPEYNVPPSLVRIPVYNFNESLYQNKVENIEGYTFVDTEILNGKDAFALRIHDDSMAGDRIKKGDIAIVVKQNHVETEDIALVAVNNDYATLKRVKKEGDVSMLIPSNSAMQPILVKSKEIEIIGKVVEVKFQPK